MEEKVLDVHNCHELKDWFESNSGKETECWLKVEIRNPASSEAVYYLDAIEEALCFGWTEGTHKIGKGGGIQEFVPREKGSVWTELDKERVRRLEKLGLMTEAGRRVLPEMGADSFRIDPEIESAMRKARVWRKFKSFSSLYQRVRAFYVESYKKRNIHKYKQTLKCLIDETKAGLLGGLLTRFMILRVRVRYQQVKKFIITAQEDSLFSWSVSHKREMNCAKLS